MLFSRLHSDRADERADLLRARDQWSEQQAALTMVKGASSKTMRNENACRRVMDELRCFYTLVSVSGIERNCTPDEIGPVAGGPVFGTTSRGPPEPVHGGNALPLCSSRIHFDRRAVQR